MSVYCAIVVKRKTVLILTAPYAIQHFCFGLFLIIHRNDNAFPGNMHVMSVMASPLINHVT